MFEPLEGQVEDRPQNGSLERETCWIYSHTVDSVDDIIAFALSLGTKNRIHLDHEAAVEMGFRTIVAPGIMLCGFVEEAITEHAPKVILREIDLKFRNPLYAPSLVTVDCTVTDKDRAGGTTVLVKIRDSSGVLAFGTCRILEPSR